MLPESRPSAFAPIVCAWRSPIAGTKTPCQYSCPDPAQRLSASAPAISRRAIFDGAAPANALGIADPHDSRWACTTNGTGIITQARSGLSENDESVQRLPKLQKQGGALVRRATVCAASRERRSASTQQIDQRSGNQPRGPEATSAAVGQLRRAIDSLQWRSRHGSQVQAPPRNRDQIGKRRTSRRQPRK